MILKYTLVCTRCGEDCDRRTARRIRIRRKNPSDPHLIAFECRKCGNRAFNAFLVEDPDATVRKHGGRNGNIVIITDESDIRINADP